MARYRVICTGRFDLNTRHRHVASVGIGKHAGNVSSKWTMGAVRDALKAGSRFYTMNSSGLEVDVVPFDCSCGVKTITQSAMAADHEGDLPLPACGWVA